ncbi:MAG: NAD(+)/NADH kinase [Candidatus Zixiibacteriota bacterium]|nr:MAG: NAD(+)/NADH kinase [candidate division Zixibacteria bacterium]
MNRFGIIGHLDRPQIKKITNEIISWSEKNGIECRICNDLARLVGSEDISSDLNDIWKCSDVIISLGGDGSMLSSARVAGPHGIPVLGINLGGLGFLTEISENQLFRSLERLKSDDFEIEERMMLEASVPDLDSDSHMALNDVVYDHGYASNLAKLDLYSNDHYVCSYDADGIIISSPTGSTAYSLSAGGPIMNPLMDALIVNPISPHTLTLRPIVFPSTDKITVKAVGKGRKIRISTDGRILGNLEYEQTSSVRKSDHRLKLIKLNGDSFFEILRSKLHWGARPLLNS